MTTEPFARGGYRYIPGPFQYSAGVVAESGHVIERVTFRAPLPLRQGFARVAAILRARGRPLTSFCACELRSPAPMSDAGFRAFNETYVATLAQWGIYDEATKRNPVARSNVCPKVHAPGEPSLHAFSFTVAAGGQLPTFVVAGSGEAREGGADYRRRTIRYGETTADAMREKANYVLAEMERRLRELGVAWADTSATQVYTVHDLHPIYAEAIADRGACGSDLAPGEAAGRRSGVRDGLPRGGRGTFRGLMRSGRGNGRRSD